MGGELSAPINSHTDKQDSMTSPPTYPEEDDEDLFSDSPPMTPRNEPSSSSLSSSLPSLAQKLYSSNILHQTTSAQVWSFAFSPLHPHVAAGTDEHLIIYDTSTLTPIQTLVRKGTTRSVAYSSAFFGEQEDDSSSSCCCYLAAGGDDRRLTLYEYSETNGEYHIRKRVCTELLL